MSKRNRVLFTLLAAVALVAAGFTLRTAVARDRTPVHQDNLTLGESQVRQLLPLMPADKYGDVSKEDFMSFMAAEYSRLDPTHEGEINVADALSAETHGPAFSSAGK